MRIRLYFVPSNPLPPFLFSSANHSHMMALLQQLLYSESLSLSWRDIIVPVVRQVVQTVRPDVRNCDDDMDIRQLVHIKKVGRQLVELTRFV